MMYPSSALCVEGGEHRKSWKGQGVGEKASRSEGSLRNFGMESTDKKWLLKRPWKHGL